MDQDHLPPFYGGSTDPNQYSYPDDYSYPDQYSYSDSNPMSYPPSSAGAYTAYASVATGAVHDYPASDQQGDGSGEPAYPQTSTDTGSISVEFRTKGSGKKLTMPANECSENLIQPEMVTKLGRDSRIVRFKKERDVTISSKCYKAIGTIKLQWEVTGAEGAPKTSSFYVCRNLPCPVYLKT